MTRWRKRIGPEAMERVLQATVELALETKTIKPSSLERVTVDTTVQEKAIAHPTDSRLYLKALQALVRQAKKAGIILRQSHTRLAKKAAAKAFEANPYDGHTPQATIDQAAAMSGVEPERIYADKGYQGHDYEGDAQVLLSGRRRGLTPIMKRELRRRSAIEPMICHAKNDGQLGRNHLLGQDGDKINALLAAAGHNLRLILNKLRLLLVRILKALLGPLANPNTSLGLATFQTSSA